MASAENIIEDAISSPSVFKDKTKLYPEYLPERLPRREKQLKSLANTFKSLISNPGESVQKAVLVGSYGTGKTVTSRVFGRILTGLAAKKGIKLKYVHVNCYKARTLPQVLHAISKELDIYMPPRGLSVQEMMRTILDELERRKIYTIITMDEFDYFVSSNPNSSSIYTLVRIYDDEPHRTKRVNFIFIARNAQVLDMLEPAASTFFIKNVISFPPYSSQELYDILSDRVPLAFHEGVIDDNVVRYVADLEGADKEGGSGSARTALEILVRAGESADSEGRGYVTIEDVRKAHVVVKPELAMLQDTIEALGTHHLILLLAIVKTLRKRGEPFVRIGDVEDEYVTLCESYKERNRHHTQVYTYIMDMRNMRIIQTKTSGKGFRGKSTLIGINNAPLEILEKRIEEILEKKLAGDGKR